MLIFLSHNTHRTFVTGQRIVSRMRRSSDGYSYLHSLFYNFIKNSAQMRSCMPPNYPSMPTSPESIKMASWSSTVANQEPNILVHVAHFLIVPIKDIKNSRERIAALFLKRVFGVKTGKDTATTGSDNSAAGNAVVVTLSPVRSGLPLDSILTQIRSSCERDSTAKVSSLLRIHLFLKVILSFDGRFDYLLHLSTPGS